jgi:thiamine pyrophosphate-dependent acetolactate synthase large subunit-like protein
MIEPPALQTSYMPPQERPRPSACDTLYGSDAVADVLQELGIPFIALNPGASYRGLHDSLVNRLGNRTPQILLCLHEVTAVAIAHGYAKVAEQAMAVALHSNVGLMNGSMAIFNAWCDRMPMLVLGATGPVDAAERRPWIDWIHTARDQGALVRHYTKWDDQPASPKAAREAIQRALWLSNNAPRAPVYINLDAGMQEAPLAAPLPPIDHRRFMPAVEAGIAPGQLDRLVALLRGSERIVLLCGRAGRSQAAWNARVALAEALKAQVVSDGKLGAVFPTDHSLHIGNEGSKASCEAVRTADLVVSLDWVDLGGMLKLAFKDEAPGARIVQISPDYQIHNGWSMDHQGLPPVDLLIPCDPDQALQPLLAAMAIEAAPAPVPAATVPDFVADGGPITVRKLAKALRYALDGRPSALLRVCGGWSQADWPLRAPGDYYGSIGGAGLGTTPGMAIGAALALKTIGSDRLPIAVNGDGDFLMGATALWTAAHYQIPLLYVVANNASYLGDEHHQKHVAAMRGRNQENCGVGLRISDPEVDIVGLARAQGVRAFGPVGDDGELEAVFREAIEAVANGACVVVDVRTQG